jgi:hypothetical protein
MEAIYSSETSVDFQQTARVHITQDKHFHSFDGTVNLRGDSQVWQSSIFKNKTGEKKELHEAILPLNVLRISFTTRIWDFIFLYTPNELSTKSLIPQLTSKYVSTRHNFWLR